MAKQSAGLLMYRFRDGRLQVLLAHPGGPLWQNKDAGIWTIPKGEFGSDEVPLAAARREFTEETGLTPQEPFLPLGRIQQKSGKIVYAWAFEGDCDPAAIRSNTFQMEWPPKSGNRRDFPEIDRADFFDLPAARAKINSRQADLLDTLAALLNQSNGESRA